MIRGIVVRRHVCSSIGEAIRWFRNFNEPVLVTDWYEQIEVNNLGEASIFFGKTLERKKSFDKTMGLIHQAKIHQNEHRTK